MGWEVWTKQERKPPSRYFPKGYVKTRIGFFCNTADTSFGPVLYIGESWKGVNEEEIRNHFYEAFSQAAEELHDPNSGEPIVDARCCETGQLREIAQRAIEIMEAEVTV